MKAIILAIFLFSVFGGVLGQTCSSHTNCNTCLNNGCYFCNKWDPNITDFCTATSQTAVTSGCNTNDGENSDIFITALEFCKGSAGCGAAERCSECNNADFKAVGCGWCFKGNSVVCLSDVRAATECDVFSGTGSYQCTPPPCEAEFDCYSCSENERGCTWCQEDGNSDVTAGSCYVEGDSAIPTSCNSTCPPLPPNSGYILSISWKSIFCVVTSLIYFGRMY